MAQATKLRKADADLNLLTFFKKLPVQLQAKIIASGLFVLAKNFSEEDKAELFYFLCSYRSESE